MLRINAFLNVQKENRVAVIEIAKKLVEASVKEEGCIAYDFFESTTREGVFMFCETWADQASIDAHNKTEHFSKLLPQLQALATVKLEILKM